MKSVLQSTRSTTGCPALGGSSAKEMSVLADYAIGRDVTTIETLREQAGYLMVCHERLCSPIATRSAYLDKAQDILTRADQLYKGLCVTAPRMELPLLRAHIELALLMNKSSEAEPKIHDSIIICRDYPIAYCIDQLQSLLENLHKNHPKCSIDAACLCQEVKAIPRLGQLHSNMLVYQYLDEEMNKLSVGL